MKGRKAHLRFAKIPSSEKVLYSDQQWEEIRAHLQPTDDEWGLMMKLHIMAEFYFAGLGVNPRTNLRLSSRLRSYEKTAAVIDQLLSLLEEVDCAELLKPSTISYAGIVDAPALRIVDPRAPTFHKNGLKYLSWLSAKLKSAVASYRGGTDFLTPKQRLLISILRSWHCELHRPLLSGGGGKMAQFVFACANPILEIGGQRIANLNATRTALRDLLSIPAIASHLLRIRP